jgi:hypothetical protein
LCDWLAGQLFPPAVRILAIVPWECRYSEERRWTVLLAKKHDLFNISFGAAPLRRGPMPAETRRKIAATKARRHRGGTAPPAAAA